MNLSGMTILESEWLTEAGEPRPGWFPCGGGWKVKRIYTPQVPFRGAYQTGPSTLVMHPAIARELRRQLSEVDPPVSSSTEDVEIVVNGRPVTVKAGPIRSVIAEAIEQAGQIGAPIDQWVLRTTDGDVIPHELPGGLEYAVCGGRRLWLHLGLPPVLSTTRRLPWDGCPNCRIENGAWSLCDKHQPKLCDSLAVSSSTEQTTKDGGR